MYGAWIWNLNIKYRGSERNKNKNVQIKILKNAFYNRVNRMKDLWKKRRTFYFVFYI